MARMWIPKARQTTTDLIAATEQVTAQRSRTAGRIPSVLGSGASAHVRLTETLTEIAHRNESLCNLDRFIDDHVVINPDIDDGCKRKPILVGQHGSSITDDRTVDEDNIKHDQVLPLPHLNPDNDLLRTMLIESTKRECSGTDVWVVGV